MSADKEATSAWPAAPVSASPAVPAPVTSAAAVHDGPRARMVPGAEHTLFSGYGPFVALVGLILAMALLAPTIAPERDVTTRPGPAAVQGRASSLVPDHDRSWSGPCQGLQHDRSCLGTVETGDPVAARATWADHGAPVNGGGR